MTSTRETTIPDFSRHRNSPNPVLPTPLKTTPTDSSLRSVPSLHLPAYRHTSTSVSSSPNNKVEKRLISGFPNNSTRPESEQRRNLHEDLVSEASGFSQKIKNEFRVNSQSQSVEKHIVNSQPSETKRFSFGIQENKQNLFTVDSHKLVAKNDDTYHFAKNANESDKILFLCEISKRENVCLKEEIQSLKREIVGLNNCASNQTDIINSKNQEIEHLKAEISSLKNIRTRQNFEKTNEQINVSVNCINNASQNFSIDKFNEHRQDAIVGNHFGSANCDEKMRNQTTSIRCSPKKALVFQTTSDRLVSNNVESGYSQIRQPMSPVKGENLRNFLRNIDPEIKKQNPERTVSVKRYVIKDTGRELVSEERVLMPMIPTSDTENKYFLGKEYQGLTTTLANNGGYFVRQN